MAGVDITSLLTVGDMPAGNGYRMVGIPDGMGGFHSGANEITLLMNHELTDTAGSSGPGIVRAHGSSGAFVSKWTVRRDDLAVLAGSDLIRTVHQWNPASGSYITGTTAFRRLCSGDLPPESALRHGNRGTSERMFMSGEEVDDGRGWAHVVTGEFAGHSWELPRLGKYPYENIQICPNGKDKTIAVGLEDGDLSTSGTAPQPCELWVYIGVKQTSGNPVERAGLTNGKLYGARIRRNDGTLVTEESDPNGLGNASTGYIGVGTFELVQVGPDGDVSGMTAVQLRDEAVAKDITRLRRIEDGHWDPRGARKNDFYFVTTASFTTRSRLWRLRFNNIDDPLAGGTIEIVINGGANGVGGPDVRMFDNICVDQLGRVLLQEDVGSNAHVGKIWLYGTDSGELVEIAEHNPKFFTGSAATNPNFHTLDEESSGVFDAQQLLGQGWFIFDVQDHQALGGELVQRGQLLAMYVHPTIGR